MTDKNPFSNFAPYFEDSWKNIWEPIFRRHGELAPTESPLNRALITRLRKAHNMTQKDLAFASSITQATISRLEAGELTDIRISTLVRIAYALQVPPGLLIES